MTTPIITLHKLSSLDTNVAAAREVTLADIKVHYAAHDNNFSGRAEPPASATISMLIELPGLEKSPSASWNKTLDSLGFHLTFPASPVTNGRNRDARRKSALAAFFNGAYNPEDGSLDIDRLAADIREAILRHANAFAQARAKELNEQVISRVTSHCRTAPTCFPDAFMDQRDAIKQLDEQINALKKQRSVLRDELHATALTHLIDILRQDVGLASIVDFEALAKTPREHSFFGD